MNIALPERKAIAVVFDAQIKETAGILYRDEPALERVVDLWIKSECRYLVLLRSSYEDHVAVAMAAEKEQLFESAIPIMIERSRQWEAELTVCLYIVKEDEASVKNMIEFVMTPNKTMH